MEPLNEGIYQRRPGTWRRRDSEAQLKIEASMTGKSLLFYRFGGPGQEFK